MKRSLAKKKTDSRAFLKHSSYVHESHTLRIILMCVELTRNAADLVISSRSRVVARCVSEKFAEKQRFPNRFITARSVHWPQAKTQTASRRRQVVFITCDEVRCDNSYGRVGEKKKKNKKTVWKPNIKTIPWRTMVHNGPPKVDPWE